MKLSRKKIKWNKTYRVISTQHPPIDLFERVAGKEEWEALCDYEAAYNPRVRNTLFTHADTVYGNGASYVMAPFFYKLPPGRFTTEDFGGYYATKDLLTAIAEKAFHIAKFYQDSDEEKGIIEHYLVLQGKIDTVFHDIRHLPMAHPVYKPGSYVASQKLAVELKQKESNGIIYNSVRNTKGICFVAFKPKCVPIPIPTLRPAMHWDGEKMDKWFDGKEWLDLYYSHTR